MKTTAQEAEAFIRRQGQYLADMKGKLTTGSEYVVLRLIEEVARDSGVEIPFELAVYLGAHKAARKRDGIPL